MPDFERTITFNEYQTQAKEYAIYPKEKALEYLVAGLASEAGEVAGAYKRIIRDNASTTKVAYELGDLLWYMSQLALELGFTLDAIAQHNLDKLEYRKQHDKLKGEGDNR